VSRSPARVHAVGTAVPETSWTQTEIMEGLGLTHPIVRRLLRTNHIEKRHLILPERDPSGLFRKESVLELREKFARGAHEVGGEAMRTCMEHAGVAATEVGYLATTTSTGFTMPGLSAQFVPALGMRADTQRLDVVGMGCNAGMNALGTAARWAQLHPGRWAMVVCCEINSAIYSEGDDSETAIVNSLFGDGVAAVLLNTEVGTSTPQLLDFASCIFPEEATSMRFDQDAHDGRFRFRLSRAIPYVLGVKGRQPIIDFLERHGLKRSQIRHWILHTGGGAVIDAMKMGLNLTEHDVRHTRSVLREYGNLSSGSFLFSYRRLVDEQSPSEGDFGVMIAMGPGAQIELGLLQW